MVCHAHRVNTPACGLQIFSPHPNYPVTDVGSPAYHGHTASECTHSLKRVGGKAEVIPHDINIYLGHSTLAARSGRRVNRLPLSPAWLFKWAVLAFNRVDYAIGIPVYSCA